MLSQIGSLLCLGSKCHYRWHLYYTWVHLLHFCLPQSPSEARVLQNDTEISSTNGEQMKKKEVTDKSSERKTEKKRSFQTQLGDHTELPFENGAMFSHFCHKSKKANSFGLAGCRNVRTSTLQRHKDSKDHQDAVHEEAIHIDNVAIKLSKTVGLIAKLRHLIAKLRHLIFTVH